MRCPAPRIEPNGRLWRIGHDPDPWLWPDWQWVSPATWWNDNDGAGRWDDPEREYRVLYASSSRLAAFLETLSHLEPDQEIHAAWFAIDGDDDDLALGEVGTSWLEKRRIGSAEVKGHFAPVGHSEWLSYLRGHLADFAASHGVAYVDAAAVRLTAPREVTQAMSRLVQQCSSASDQIAGVQYLSRHGDDFQNWALFESAQISSPDSAEIARDDADFEEARRRFSLVLVDD